MTIGSGLFRRGRRPLAGALALIALGTALFVGLAWRYHRVLVADAQERTARLSFLLSEQVARTVEAVDFTLRGFEPLLSLGAGRDELADLLRRRVSDIGVVERIRILDARGDIVAASDTVGPGASHTDCLAALALPSAPPLAIGCSVGEVGAAGRPAITVARRLSDATGQSDGAVVADLDPGYFSRFFTNLDLGRNALVTLTENHGHVLLASTCQVENVGPGCPMLVAPSERARLRVLERLSREQITAEHATEGYPLSVTVGIDRRDVDHRWWQAVAPTFALTLAAAGLLFTVAFNVERHRAERARALRRAAVAQKLEAMGQMTASVAHDFRNVLTAIEGSLRLIGKRGPTPAVTGEAAASLARGNAMVDRLLAFSRRQDLRLETQDVNAILAELATTLRHLAGLECAVTLALAPALPPCRLDRVQFEAALMNLVVNARQAMPNGGTVAITTAITATGLDVAVRDTGGGIDAATLKRVFEPFFTTKALTGTGLGLAQVQAFLGEIGGRVSIDSTVGVGTTVFLHLAGAPGGPVSVAPPLEAIVGSGAPPASSSAQGQGPAEQVPDAVGNLEIERHG